MTYDEMQTSTIARADELVDGILWAISEIRKVGVVTDRAGDLLAAIVQDASRASAINARLCSDDLDLPLAEGRTSSVAGLR